MMPGMDGHAFSRAVKADETLKHIPIILVTARTGAEMLAEGHPGRGRRLHLQALRLDRAQGPHPVPAPHAADGIGAGPGQQEPPDEDLRPRRAAAVAVPVDGQVAGLGHRRQGRVHAPSLDPGHGLLAEDRRQDGLQREGAGRPRAGRPPPRRRQDRRPREHPEQAGQADRRGVHADQGTSGPRRGHPQPGHRAQGDRPRRPVPPRALRRDGLPRPAARAGRSPSAPAS